MTTIQSVVPMRVRAAIVETTGEVVEVGTRIGWLLDLVTGLSTDLMQRCWQPARLAGLHDGVDSLGRKLPSTAAVVAQRLGWIPRPAEGVYVPSRVARLAQANVVPILKTMAYRDRLIPHVAAALDEHGCLDAARLDEQCRYVSTAFLRNMARQLRRNAGEQVTSVTQLQRAPAVARLARLGAVDAQFARLDCAGAAGVWLRIKLPLTAAPAGRADWAWVKLWCPIPPHLKDREIRIWHLPTIAMHRGSPLLRFTITEAVPEPDTANAVAALGIDWSPDSLGAASVVAERGGELVSDARTHVYNDRGLGVRLARLQTEGEQLSAKIDRLTRLAANAPESTKTQLNAKIAVLQQHRSALGAKRRRINREIAFDFAATMTAMATASGAGVIAVEDLSGLEAGGRGKANNNRAAQLARRRAYRAMEHTAARAGLEVVMCPPRGTSALCPSCNDELARPNGYHSATCTGCGINGANRDQIAGQNIAKRVLLTKTRVKRPKNKPKRITTVEHRPVAKTRRKTSATPTQRRHKRTRHTTPLRTTTNKTHPARQASVWDRDQPTAPAEGTSAQPISNTCDNAQVSASARDRQTLQQA
jgi:Putative transposase DNA-binding domain